VIGVATPRLVVAAARGLAAGRPMCSLTLSCLLKLEMTIKPTGS